MMDNRHKTSKIMTKNVINVCKKRLCFGMINKISIQNVEYCQVSESEQQRHKRWIHGNGSGFTSN